MYLIKANTVGIRIKQSFFEFEDAVDKPLSKLLKFV